MGYVCKYCQDGGCGVCSKWCDVHRAWEFTGWAGRCKTEPKDQKQDVMSEVTSAEKYLDLMLDTARKIALAADVQHPEDLGAYVITSIESSIVLLTALWEEEHKRDG